MTDVSEDLTTTYRVLINQAGQYALWSASHLIPPGWTAVGPTGQRQLCLDWIEANWTDMRPSSVIAGSAS
jgi:MbtH protein